MLSVMFLSETLVFSNNRCYLVFVIHAFLYSKMFVTYHIDIVTIYVTIGLYIIGDWFPFYKCVLLELCIVTVFVTICFIRFTIYMFYIVTGFINILCFIE